MYNPNPNPKPDPDPNPNPNPNQAPIAPRVIFKEAAAAWRTSEQNPRVQQDRRAAEEAEARLVEDSKTWGAPGLALITEHNKKLFIQEFIGAGALEGGRTGAGTEQVRLLEDHYEGKGYERWDGHVYEYNPQGKNFWLERLPGKVIKDAEEMIPERHVSDEHMGEYSEWTYFTIDSTSLRARFQELNMDRAFRRRRVVTYSSLCGPGGLKESDPEAYASVEQLVRKVHSDNGPGHECDVADILCDDAEDPAEVQTRVFLFYMEPRAPAPEPTDGEDLEHEQEDESGRGSAAQPEQSWGAKDVREAMNWLLLTRLRGWVVLPDSVASYLGVQVSLDAASIRRAQKGRKHWTTVIMKVLCAGVRDGRWGINAVVHQLQNAHCPHKFAKVRVWNGKDDWANFEAHVKPMIEQLLKVSEQEAYTVPKMIMTLPPVIMQLGDEVDEPVDATHRWPAAESSPPKKKRQRRTRERGEDDEHEEDDDDALDAPEQVWAKFVRLPRGDPTKREACVRGTGVHVSMNMGGDGGFLSSGAGEGATIASDRPSLLDDQTKDERQQPYAWVWLDAGEDVRTWCERNEPGDAGFLTAALMGLDSRRRCDMVPLTRKPPTRTRMDAVAPPAAPRRGFRVSAASVDRDRQARQQQNAAALSNSAGADVAEEWDDQRLNDLAFDPETFEPKVRSDGGEEGQRYGVDSPLTEPELLRLPVKVPIAKRHLTNPAWGEVPLLARICLCILHGGMRTCESLVNYVCEVRARAPQPAGQRRPRAPRSVCRQPQRRNAEEPSSPSTAPPQKRLYTKYTPNKVKCTPWQALLDDLASSRTLNAVNQHVNTALVKLKCTKLALNPETNAHHKISFDGTAAHNLIDDLHEGLVQRQPDVTSSWGLATPDGAGGSTFLRGVARAYKALNASDDYASVLKMLPMLRSYAIAMKSALKMRPSAEDYALVDEHMRRFALHKALLWPGRLTWYDTQMLYAFPKLMRQWGSLRLLSQEGMEAWQKVLNDILRLGNGFANTGAIPKAVHAKGEAAEREYMCKRAADKPDDAQWVYNQAVLGQHAHDTDVLKRLAALQQMPGRDIKWRSEFCVWWRRWMAAGLIFARWRRCFLLRRYRPYYQALLTAHRRWWAPVELSAADLAPKVARKQAAVKRRERYARLPKTERLLAVTTEQLQTEYSTHL